MVTLENVAELIASNAMNHDDEQRIRQSIMLSPQNTLDYEIENIENDGDDLDAFDTVIVNLEKEEAPVLIRKRRKEKTFRFGAQLFSDTEKKNGSTEKT